MVVYLTPLTMKLLLHISSTLQPCCCRVTLSHLWPQSIPYFQLLKGDLISSHLLSPLWVSVTIPGTTVYRLVPQYTDSELSLSGMVFLVGPLGEMQIEDWGTGAWLEAKVKLRFESDQLRYIPWQVLELIQRDFKTPLILYVATLDGNRICFSFLLCTQGTDLGHGDSHTAGTERNRRSAANTQE